MSKKSKQDESIESSDGAFNPARALETEVCETAPMTSVTIEMHMELAEELKRITGKASLLDAVRIALRTGMTALHKSPSNQEQAVDALFKATKEDMRKVMKLNSPGR